LSFAENVRRLSAYEELILKMRMRGENELKIINERLESVKSLKFDYWNSSSYYNLDFCAPQIISQVVAAPPYRINLNSFHFP
jgi:hypothetical protein